MTPLAPLLQAFFIDRLAHQRAASPHTIAAYRDSFRLLLGFLHEQTGKAPSRLGLDDLDADRIAAFLAHLERERGNGVRTRNARLTAIHSFFQFAALKVPEQAQLIARGARHPREALRHHPNQLPHRTRDRRAPSRAGTAPPGPAGATTHCCCSRSRPGCEPPNSRACAAKTSSSQPAPGSDAKAKAERKDARRSPARQSRCCASGYAARRPARQGPVPRRNGRHLTGRAIWRRVVSDRHRPGTLSHPRQQEHHPTRPAPHRRHAAATRANTSRHRDDRVVARSRDARLDQQVPPRRHGTQTTRA